MRINDFDEIVLLGCSANKYRIPAVLRECERVGLSRHPRFRISTNDTSCQHNAASVFRSALRSGCRRLLVLEDDIRFLKDAAAARRIIESGPTSCDCVLYDIFPNWCDNFVNRIKARRDAGVAFMGMIPLAYGTSCYSVGARYMENFLKCHEANPDQPCDSALFTCHPDMETCFSLRPPCVQVLYGNAGNMRFWNAQHDCYRRWIGSYDDFNVEEGYTFGTVLPVGRAE